MKLTLDTNVLVRAVVCDHKEQAALAKTALEEAEMLVVTLPSLCEFVWVLLRVYNFEVADVADAIRTLLAVDKVIVDRPAVEAGLSIVEAGGDFADGVIAYQGRWTGGETFISFDKKAVALLTTQGHSACLLSS
jgi:predicted nucleic-acid-binding protein